MTTAGASAPLAASVSRRCVAPAAFLLAGLWGATWMAQPGHVPGDIDRVATALQALHPRQGASDLPGEAPLTPAERSAQVAGKFGGLADVTIASSLLAILFGILAGPAPRRWLFRFHRWARFVALCLTAALGIGMLAELSPDAALIVIGLLPFALPLSVVAGLVWTLLPSRRGEASGHAAPPDRHPLASLLSQADAPELWSLVEQAADRCKVARPRHLLGGMTDGFFLQSGHVHPLGAKRALGGPVLHVPLRLLPLLDRDELLAALVRTLVRDGTGRRWWRGGDGRADAIAASAAGAQAAATSLLRVRAGMTLLRERLDAVAGSPDTLPEDFVEDVLVHAAGGLPDPFLPESGDPEDSMSGTGRAAERHVRRLGSRHDPATLARARAAPEAAEIAAAAKLLPHGPSLRAALTAQMASEARANAKALDEAIDDMRRSVPPLVVVHESGFGQARTGAGLLLFGLLALAFVSATAARLIEVALVLLGLATMAYAVVVFRRRGVPVLRADARGLACPGLTGPDLPWAVVQSLTSMVAFGVLTLDVRLVPGTSLPSRSGLWPFVQLRRRSSRLVIGGVMPGRAGLRRCLPELEALSAFVAAQALASARDEGAIVPLGQPGLGLAER